MRGPHCPCPLGLPPPPGVEGDSRRGERWQLSFSFLSPWRHHSQKLVSQPPLTMDTCPAGDQQVAPSESAQVLPGLCLLLGTSRPPLCGTHSPHRFRLFPQCQVNSGSGAQGFAPWPLLTAPLSVLGAALVLAQFSTAGICAWGVSLHPDGVRASMQVDTTQGRGDPGARATQCQPWHPAPGPLPSAWYEESHSSALYPSSTSVDPDH